MTLYKQEEIEGKSSLGKREYHCINENEIFLASRPALQEMLKGVLQAEGK